MYHLLTTPRVFFLMIAFWTAMLPSPVNGQTVSDTVRFVESVWSLRKRAIVLQYMDLTEADKSAFWPIYESYCRATQYLEMEYIQMLSEYSKDKGNIENKHAERLSTRLLKNDFIMARVRKQYYKKLKRVVSPLQAGEFMQLDNTLRTMLRLEIQKDSPPMELSQKALYSKSI